MKFSIRDLFLVTFIVALAVGWWLDRSRLQSRCRFSEEEIRKMVWATDHMEQVERELNKRGLEMVTVKGKIVIVPASRPNQPKELSPVWTVLATRNPSLQWIGVIYAPLGLLAEFCAPFRNALQWYIQLWT